MKKPPHNKIIGPAHLQKWTRSGGTSNVYTKSDCSVPKVMTSPSLGTGEVEGVGGGVTVGPWIDHPKPLTRRFDQHTPIAPPPKPFW